METRFSLPGTPNYCTSEDVMFTPNVFSHVTHLVDRHPILFLSYYTATPGDLFADCLA